MNFGTIEQEEIVIVVMNTLQECYNNPCFTHLAHSNPSNKIEYARWQCEPPIVGLMVDVLSSFIVL